MSVELPRWLGRLLFRPVWPASVVELAQNVEAARGYPLTELELERLLLERVVYVPRWRRAPGGRARA